MSYDLMVLDKRKRFKAKDDFLEWYDALTEWSEDIDYNDYRHATPNLQSWFLEMKAIVPPLNGEFAPSDDELGNGRFQEADYSIAKEAIYAAFAWSDAEEVHALVSDLARKNDLAFFDISANHVIYPDGFVLDLDDKEKKPSLLKRLKSFLGL